VDVGPFRNHWGLVFGKGLSLEKEEVIGLKRASFLGQLTVGASQRVRATVYKGEPALSGNSLGGRSPKRIKRRR